MSRGLGKTQQAIIEHLESNGGSMPLSNLAFDLEYHEIINFKDKQSAYAGVSRACTKLEKRGLVRKKRKLVEGQKQCTAYSDIFPVRIIELVKR